MRIRPWFRRNRTIIRLTLLVIIIALAIFAWTLREPPVNDSYQFVHLIDEMNMPTSLDQIDGDDRMFISLRAGSILVYKDGTLLETPFLNIEDKVESSFVEQGLLRIIFDPDSEENGYFYVHYTSKPDGHTVIERYTISEDNPDHADVDSAELVYTTEQIEQDHNGGDMHFGPDGYLYIALGDSGVGAESANISSPLGSILRIDVGDLPYTIPEDNPFVDVEDAAPEIWLYGFRNPWRFSFDRETGDMYVGDVGQQTYEEVDFIPAPITGGLNFGWPDYEGLLLRGETEVPDVVMPVYQYEHFQEGIDARVYQCAVTSGYVYRGEALPNLQGYYLFGDWCSGSLWTLNRDANGDWVHESFMETSFRVNAFAEDHDGELYLLSGTQGLWKLVAR